MYKKLLIVVISAMFICFGIMACGGGNEGDDTTPAPTVGISFRTTSDAH